MVYSVEVPALMRSADSGERRVRRQGKGFGWLHAKGTRKKVTVNVNQLSSDT